MTFHENQKKSIYMLALKVNMTENQSFVVASICILLLVLIKKKFQVYFTYNLPSTDEKKMFSSERVSLRNYSIAGGDKKRVPPNFGGKVTRYSEGHVGKALRKTEGTFA